MMVVGQRCDECCSIIASIVVCDCICICVSPGCVCVFVVAWLDERLREGESVLHV